MLAIRMSTLPCCRNCTRFGASTETVLVSTPSALPMPLASSTLYPRCSPVFGSRVPNGGPLRITPTLMTWRCSILSSVTSAWATLTASAAQPARHRVVRVLAEKRGFMHSYLERWSVENDEPASGAVGLELFL